MTMPALLERFGSMVKEAMRHVTSADKAYQWLRAQEIDITRSAVRDVWRTVGEKERWETVIQTWGMERVIPHGWVVTRETKESTALLQYTHAQWYDPETGETKDVYHSWAVDKLRSGEDFIADVYDTEVDYAEMFGYELIGLWFAGAEQCVIAK